MLLTQGELVDGNAIEPLPEGTRAWELLRGLARYEQPAKVRWVLQDERLSPMARRASSGPSS